MVEFNYALYHERDAQFRDDDNNDDNLKLKSDSYTHKFSTIQMLKRDFIHRPSVLFDHNFHINDL